MAVRLLGYRADRPSFTPGKLLVHISVRGWMDPWIIIRLEGLVQLQNPIIWYAMEPAIFRFVA
jgi:hypothetical protein